MVKPLSPPDFSGEFHLPVPSIGCVGSCRTHADQEVHTIRLSTKFSGHQTPQVRRDTTFTVYQTHSQSTRHIHSLIDLHQIHQNQRISGSISIAYLAPPPPNTCGSLW